jgi:adenosylhomocysteine nucleosidase
LKFAVRSSEFGVEEGPRVCVVTAADVEFKTVAALLDGKSFSSAHEIKVCRGRAGRLRVTLLEALIGAPGFEPKFAAHLAANLYDGLLVIGLAGALDARLRAGDTILYDECLKPDSAHFPALPAARQKPNLRETAVPVRCDARLTGALRAALSASGRCELGAGVTAPVMVTQAAAKLALGAEWRAAAVDMESYGVVATALRCEVPAAVVRVVLDEAGQDTPDFNRALARDGRMNAGAALLAMAARPAAAARFLRSLRPALAALGRASAVALGDEVWRAFAAARNGESRASAKPSRG